MAEYRILVPLDGSRLAEHSLVYLRALKRMGEPNLRLLSVVDESEDFHALGQKEAGDREFNVLSTYLREVEQDVEKHLRIKADAKVVRGAPASRILEEAASFSPHLLMISTHGRSGISRWRFGSVADKIIRAAECNTLVIGPRAAQQDRWLEADMDPAFESILVPLDGSPLAEQALPVALAMAECFGSELHLVRAVPIPATADGMGSEIVYIPDLLDTMMSAAKSYMETTVRGLKASGAVKSDVIVGPAAFQLEDYAVKNSIDLVVMTSHGRGGIVRAALGSVTDRLLGGGAPVLVVRSKA